MKYVLISGTKDAGKSTTIDAICKKLDPDSIERVHPENGSLSVFGANEKLENGCFVLNLQGFIVVVSAGAPTENGITITLLIEVVIKLKGRVDFAIVAMRSYERSDGFDTPAELRQLGEQIWSDRICLLEGDYENAPAWKARINDIVTVLREHGLPVAKTVLAEPVEM